MLQACSLGNSKENPIEQLFGRKQYSSEDSLVKASGLTIDSRFGLPEGYTRDSVSSFGNYLRKLPLLAYGSHIKLFDGREKGNQQVHEAVVDLPIGKKDLHQCADAVMRLRAEHLWNEKQYNLIHFNLTNGFRVDYTEWMKGKRVIVEGNKTYWKTTTNASNTYKDFWKYMEFIFTYAGTLSLSKELKPVSIEELKIGDVFIKGGSPGHAVIVIDVAIHQKTKKKIFLLAQSYMPAQQIQVLKNYNSDEMSPWYSEDFGDFLETPEWTFKSTELMRFED